MKIFQTFLLLSLISSQIAYSQETAKIYFLRKTGFQGSAVPFSAFIDFELVCKLNNKRFSIHEVEPGEHEFSVQFAGKKAKAVSEPILLHVEAGKTYFIQMVIDHDIWVNNLYCRKISKKFADAILPKLKEDKDCRID